MAPKPVIQAFKCIYCYYIINETKLPNLTAIYRNSIILSASFLAGYEASPEMKAAERIVSLIYVHSIV